MSLRTILVSCVLAVIGGFIFSFAPVAHAATIYASPNPCLIESGKNTCTVTISWNTQDGTLAHIWVGDPSNPSSASDYACAVNGSQLVTWIPEQTKRFWMYQVSDCSGPNPSGTLLTSVDVYGIKDSGPVDGGSGSPQLKGGLVPCGESLSELLSGGFKSGSACTWCHLFVLINNIINFLAQILFGVTTLMVVYGGVRYLMSFGSPGMIQKAKGIITSALWGLIIGLLSYVIVGTLINTIAGIQNGGTLAGFSAPWDKPNCTTVPGANPSGGTAPPEGYTPNKICAYIAPNGIYACVNGSNTEALNNTCSSLADCQGKTCESIYDTQCGLGSGSLCTDPEALANQTNSKYPYGDSAKTSALKSCIQSNFQAGKTLGYGSIFTYEQTNTLCNYTRGAPTCGKCAHSINSCHYGGSVGTQGAEAIDYGLSFLGTNNATKKDYGDQLINTAVNVCGANPSGTRCENNLGQGVDCSQATHIHVNTQDCG